LREVERHLNDGRPLESLHVLDELTGTGRPTVFLLRALVRESVNDLLGALEDLEQVELSPHFRIVKGRILAKLGYGDAAIVLVQEVLEKCEPGIRARLAAEAMGIGGRRFDLLLMGWGVEADSAREFAPINIGAIVQHLTALAEFNEMKGREFNRVVRGVGPASLDLEAMDKLQPVLSTGPHNADIRRAIAWIRGWLSSDEAYLLAAMSSRVPRQRAIVEIGSFYGRSTIALARGARSGKSPMVHTIDLHHGLAGIHVGSTLAPFLKNLRSRRMRRKVEVHVSASIDFARTWRGKRVGLLFIDASHDVDSVRSDFEAWFPHMASDGYIAFHDVTQPGPNTVVRELLRHRELHILGLRDSTFVFQTSGQKVQPHDSHLAARWDKYLVSLHRNYDSWVESQELKLRNEIIRLIADMRNESAN
jgi:predicted O-methyltransferase YrrM